MSQETCEYGLEHLERILEQHDLDPTFATLLTTWLGKDWRCHRTRYKNSSRCIFHSEVKDASEFVAQFLKELEGMKRVAKQFDFTGFIFPETELRELYYLLNDSSRRALFVCATFQGEIEFVGIRFKGDANFFGALFQGKAYFNASTFQAEADFRGAIFDKDAFFTAVEFHKLEYFYKTTFHGNVSFNNMRFKGESYFLDSVFEKRTQVVGATFERPADFFGAKFVSVTFQKSTFIQSVSFVGCIFTTDADFSYTDFEEQAFFRRLPQHENWNPTLIFFSTIFKRPNVVQIIGYNLSRISFAGTDLSGILLVAARDKENRLLDEILLADSSKTTLPAQIIIPESSDADKPKSNIRPPLSQEMLMTEYRIVRKCLENNRMFNDAANLFVREMKLLRKSMSWRKDFFEKCVHYIYETVSRYGESINRPVILSFTFLLAMTFFLVSLYSRNFLDSPKYLEAVTSVFFQIRSFKDFDFLENASPSYEIVVRVTSILLLGNLLITVKRRLERR